MADQIKPESLPAKRKLALTEDEHHLIERYRLNNTAIDAFNLGLDNAIEVINNQADGDRGMMILAIEAVRRRRVSPL